MQKINSQLDFNIITQEKQQTHIKQNTIQCLMLLINLSKQPRKFSFFAQAASTKKLSSVVLKIDEIWLKDCRRLSFKTGHSQIARS